MKKQKKNEINNNLRTQSNYNVWQQYNQFIRQLYLEKPIKKPTGKQLTLKYLSKLVIVFFAAFFTTLTFYFLIDPNGLYNSGLNGFLQTISKLIVGRSDKIGWTSYYFIYYGLGLLANLLFIFILRAFFKAKLEIISTSVFYVLSQVIWTQIFGLLKLREYLFNRFNPNSWQGLSSSSQLSFTLPYYIVIAIVSAVVHTYGYSLIFQAQATPGGLEIITSHVSSQKRSKISVSGLMKIFGVLVILLITIFDFFGIENSSKMKKSMLQREIQEGNLAFNKEEKVEDTIKKWKKNTEEANKLEKNQQIKESSRIRAENYKLTAFFKNKVGESKLEKYPEEIEYYLLSSEKKINALDNEVNELKNEINRNPSKEILSEKLQRKNNLEERISKLKKESNRSLLEKYLSYVSNNERLWATVVYIFLSSFLMNQIFPRDQMILLRLHALTEENRNRALRLLKNFSPIYYLAYHKQGESQGEAIFIINCQLSKWNYYLLSPQLKEVGINHIYETT